MVSHECTRSPFCLLGGCVTDPDMCVAVLHTKVVLRSLRKFCSTSFPQSQSKINQPTTSRKAYDAARLEAYRYFADTVAAAELWYDQLITTADMRSAFRKYRSIQLERAIRVVKQCHRLCPALFDGLAVPNLCVRLSGDMTKRIPIQSIERAVVIPVNDPNRAALIEERKKLVKGLYVVIGLLHTSVKEVCIYLLSTLSYPLPFADCKSFR